MLTGHLPESGFLLSIAGLSLTDAIRITGGLGLAFTVVHVLVLLTRTREQQIQQPRANLAAAGILNLLIIVTATVCLATGGTVAFEWLLIFLLARPMLAFALVVGDVAGG